MRTRSRSPGAERGTKSGTPSQRAKPSPPATSFSIWTSTAWMSIRRAPGGGATGAAGASGARGRCSKPRPAPADRLSDLGPLSKLLPAPGGPPKPRRPAGERRSPRGGPSRREPPLPPPPPPARPPPLFPFTSSPSRRRRPRALDHQMNARDDPGEVQLDLPAQVADRVPAREVVQHQVLVAEVSRPLRQVLQVDVLVEVAAVAVLGREEGALDHQHPAGVEPGLQLEDRRAGVAAVGEPGLLDRLDGLDPLAAQGDQLGRLPPGELRRQAPLAAHEVVAEARHHVVGGEG